MTGRQADPRFRSAADRPARYQPHCVQSPDRDRDDSATLSAYVMSQHFIAARRRPPRRRERALDEPLRLRAGPRRPEMALQTHHRFQRLVPGRPRNPQCPRHLPRPHLKAQAAKID